MGDPEFIVNVERVTIKKVDDNTLNFSVMATINGRTHTIGQDISKLEKPIETNDEKQTYGAYMETIPVEKRQPMMLQVYYLDIQKNPHIRIRYMENEATERTKTYELRHEDKETYGVLKIEEYPKEI